MKHKYLLLFALLMSAIGVSAQQPHKTLIWDGQEREYIVYTPGSIDATQPRGLILMLHGLGNSIDTVNRLAHVDQFAELTGWVCVVPQALNASVPMGFTSVNLGPCWNAGIKVSIPTLGVSDTLNKNVDDEGFLLKLLDTMQQQYAIAPDSIFISGMSMGGFMTHRMMLHHNDIFAAAVPISGTIANTLEGSNPLFSQHPDIMHIHAPSDEVVSYEGDFTYSSMGLTVPHIGMSVAQTIDFWTAFNQCDNTPVIDTFADRCNDGLLFVRKSYNNGADGSRVVLVDVEGGSHTWYGNPSLTDIDYGREIYNFCAKKNLGYDEIPVGLAAAAAARIAVYPNPATEKVTIELSQAGEVVLYNTMGQQVLSQCLSAGATRLSLTGIAKGVYILAVRQSEVTNTSKLVVR